MLARFYRERFPSGSLRESGQWNLVGCIVLLSVFLCRIASALTICGSCGYESGDDSRFCSHCGGGLKAEVGERRAKGGGLTAEVGELTAEDGELTAEDGTGSSALISAEAVAWDMRTARLRLVGEDVALARMFARNAMALNLLAAEDPENVRSQAILAFIERCDRLFGRARRECPDCEGSGKRVMTTRALDGRTRDLQIAGWACERCGGAGLVQGKETVDERKYRRGQAVERFRATQQSRGRVPMGDVWVPESAVEGLDVAAAVMLKRAIPPACQRCAGIGRADCSTCRGRGIATCDAKGCERGRVERESLGGQIGGARTDSKTIHTVNCEVCKGSGLSSCEKCSGAGSFVCKSCNGEGFGKVCSKCNGAGLTTCRRCSGTRVYRGEACATCGAEGITECSSCGGIGRKR